MRSLVALLLLTSTAGAADLSLNKTPVYTKAPAVADYSWSGIYLSGFAGYGGELTSNSITAPGAGVVANIGVISQGAMVGGQLKALYQLYNSAWVVGISGDIAWANFKATSSVTTTAGANLLSLGSATNYMGCACLTLGYAIDQKLLPYLIGGIGYGGASTSATMGSGNNALANAISNTSVGYAIGGGLAYALTSNISIFTETRYYHLGGKLVNLTPPVVGATPILTSSTPFDFLTQTAGLSVKF